MPFTLICYKHIAHTALNKMWIYNTSGIYVEQCDLCFQNKDMNVQYPHWFYIINTLVCSVCRHRSYMGTMPDEFIPDPKKDAKSAKVWNHNKTEKTMIFAATSPNFFMRGNWRRGFFLYRDRSQGSPSCDDLPPLPQVGNHFENLVQKLLLIIRHCNVQLKHDRICIRKFFFLCTRAFLYLRYSFLLISNEFCHLSLLHCPLLEGGGVVQ
jgi:hypothetical protein